MKSIFPTAGALILLFAAALTACMGSSAPTKPIYYYALDYAAPFPQTDQPLPYVLRVARFNVSPPFDSRRIVYAGKGLQRNTYAYHQWIVAPGELLTYLIARDLRQTHAYKAVLPPDATLNASHTVYGWVEQFIEQDGGSANQAALRLHITLAADMEPDPDKRILFQKTYSATEPCADSTTEGLAQAMSAAAAKISAALTQDIHSQLAQRQTVTK